MIEFRIPDRVIQNEVSEAVLYIHVQELDAFRNVTVFSTDEQYTVNINISRVTRNSNNNKVSVPYSQNSVKMSRAELKAGKWLKIDMTNMVTEFFRLGAQFLSIIVRIQDSNNRMNLVVPHPSSHGNHALMPYIEVFLEDNTHKRTRRTLSMDCTEASKEVRCCRYPFVVNFEEFGWDWIIYPKQYNANYCSGECPYSFLQKDPHTIVMQLASPPNGGGPCCAPRKMSSISMMYFDHDFNIMYATIPGMVVEKCGCS